LATESALNDISIQDAIVTLGSPPLVFCLCICIMVLFYVRRNPSLIADSRTFLRKTPWKLDDSFALAMMLVFLLFLTRAIITIMNINNLLTEEQLLPLSVVAQTFVFHVPVILAIFLMLRRRGLRIRPTLGLQPSRALENVGKGILAYLSAMPAIAAANVISWLVLQHAGVPQEPQFAIKILVDPHPAWLKVYLLIMAIISAPIAEELLFRAVCFPALAKRTAPLRAAILISLLFAVIHMNAYAFLPLFVMALALSAAYAWTQSIIVPLTMHAMFNAVNLSLYALYRILEQHTP
jgi:membrane protease YdiL (CAAX protease family)